MTLLNQQFFFRDNRRTPTNYTQIKTKHYILYESTTQKKEAQSMLWCKALQTTPA
jgi:hypothetical protein